MSGALIKGIVSLTDLVGGIADAVSVDFGAAGIAITTTAGTPASPSLASATTEDTVVQALAAASGGIAGLTGNKALAATSYLLSGAGFATATQLIFAAETAAQTPPSAEDVATIKGAFVETIGDACAMLSALVKISNIELNMPGLNVAGNLLSVIGAVVSGYGLLLTKEANPDSSILISLNNQITRIQTVFNDNNSSLITAFGPVWGSISNDIVKAFNAAISVANNNDNTTIISSAISALSLFTTVGSDISGLFSNSNSAAQTITENAGVNGQTTAAVADGSLTATSSLSVNTSLSTSTISDSILLSNGESAAFSDTLIGRSGISTQVSSDAAGNISATTTLITDATGAMQQNTALNGTTITTPSSTTAQVAFDSFGLPSVYFLWQSQQDNIWIQSAADGTEQVLLSSGGTTAPQQIVDFAASGLSGESFSINYDAAGNLSIIDNISNGDVAQIVSDQSVSAVNQDFDFSGSSGTLQIDSPSAFTGTIYNFQAGDTIDLTGISATGVALGTSNILTVQESNGSSISIQLDPAQNFSGESFNAISDNNGGTGIVLYPSNKQVTLSATGNLTSGYYSDLNNTVMFSISASFNFNYPISQYYPMSIEHANAGQAGVNKNGQPFPVGSSFVPSEGVSGSFTFDGHTFILGGSGTYAGEPAPNFYLGAAITTGYENYDGSGEKPYTEISFGYNGGNSDFVLNIDLINGILLGSGGQYNGDGVQYEKIFFTDYGLLNTVGYSYGDITSLSFFDLSFNPNAIACFHSDTLVSVAHGKVAVQALEIGDLLCSYKGGFARVRWLGTRHIDCRRHPQPFDVWPVRVQQGAFGGGLPHRDLWLSPDHCVFAKGVLVAIRHLLNGSTIAQVPRDDVTYWHVELEKHDVILAEGLPCESYLNTDEYERFDNRHTAPLSELFPEPCARIVTQGVELEAIRQQLRAVAEDWEANNCTDMDAAHEGRRFA